MRSVLVLIAALALTACGKSNSQADQLDNAAKQSDPAAAAELHNQADFLREDKGSKTNISDPGSAAQNAMQAAGNAAAANPKPAAEPANQPVDPQTGLTKSK
jgi:Tfp pilus assembly protein PilP